MSGDSGFMMSFEYYHGELEADQLFIYELFVHL
jgi:hypothetical protein